MPHRADSTRQLSHAANDSCREDRVAALRAIASRSYSRATFDTGIYPDEWYWREGMSLAQCHKSYGECLEGGASPLRRLADFRRDVNRAAFAVGGLVRRAFASGRIRLWWKAPKIKPVAQQQGFILHGLPRPGRDRDVLGDARRHPPRRRHAGISRGSHLWPLTPLPKAFHGQDDYRSQMQTAAAARWGRTARLSPMRLLQNRGSSGLMRHSQAAASLARFRPQHDFRSQRRARRLRLPGRAVPDADPPRPAARSCKDRLWRTESLPRLSAARAMHERRSLGLPSRKRGRARSHGRTPQSEAANSRPSPRDCRASVRQHQAMDEPGRVPDARARQRARRVQPDRARLQFASRPQHPRRRGDDGGASGGEGPTPPAPNRAYRARTCPLRVDRERVAPKKSQNAPPAKARPHTRSPPRLFARSARFLHSKSRPTPSTAYAAQIFGAEMFAI